MKKWILIGSGAIVVIIVVLIIVGISNLGPMIKSAVNTYGPDITKTDVSLGDVDVSIFSAEARLKDFLLGNPKGFKTPQAMKVGSVYVDVDESSLTSETIIIDKIEVVAPDITYEKISGTDNFKTILNSVQKAVGAEKKSESTMQESEKKGAGKKILIKNFIVKDGKVNLSMGILGGKTISAPLPDIHLKDIGKEKKGASPAEAFEEIFSALYAKITSPAVTDIFNKGLKSLGKSFDAVKEGAQKQIEGVEKEVGEVTDKLKGLFNK